MKYKKGDKVVVEIKQADENDPFLPYKIGGEHIKWLSDSLILGKLSDFTKPEKIRFTEAEMEDFNDIRSITKELLKALTAITRTCTYYSHLKQWILEKDHPLPRNEREILFAKAWENPELIEVVKEKKYYIRILDDCYLGRNTAGNACLAYKTDASPFAQSEINKMQKLPKFQAIDLEKCKEEVEDE